MYADQLHKVVRSAASKKIMTSFGEVCTIAAYRGMH